MEEARPAVPREAPTEGENRASDNEDALTLADPNTEPEEGVAVREAKIAGLIAIGVHPDVARALLSREQLDEESYPSADKAEVDVFELLESLGRAARRHAVAMPVPVRATSDGADFVRYSGKGAPAMAHKARREAQSVVLAAELRCLAAREAPTVVIARRRPGTSRIVWASAIVVVIGIALPVAIRLAADRPPGEPLSPAPQRSTAPATPGVEPPPIVMVESVPMPNVAGSLEENGPARHAALMPGPRPQRGANGSDKAISPAASGRRPSEVETRIQPLGKTPASPLLAATTEATARRPLDVRQHYLLDLP